MQKDLPLESRELQRAQLDMGRLKETKRSAEKEKARAEFELFKARSAAKELALEIEKSNAKAMARKLELRTSRNLDVNDQKYSELMRELSSMKQELSRLKLDVASALESKAEAEEIIEASNSRARSYLSSAEEIGKKIEEANEEHVLVELARIEAERESRDIEAQRTDEAARFSKEIEATIAKIGAMQKEVDQAKELEMKLEVTNSDLDVLQSEMELVRAMERNFQKNRFEEDSESRILLKTADAELKAAKQELESIEEEGFRFMTSIDVIRKELILIVRETEQLKKQEKKADSSIQQLNSRLLKAKLRLELASAAEERSKAIVSNLSAALQQLQAEKDAVKKEKETIIEETKRTKQKIELSKENIRAAEERLQAAMLELKSTKASEAIALQKLKDVVERTMKNRASSFAHSSTLTISESEYEYLTKSAESAQVVANKKVAAAQAWIEALKSEEKEILMKTEMVKKEIKKLKTAEEKELSKIEEALADQKIASEYGLDNEEEAEFLELQHAEATPKGSMRTSTASARKVKIRRSSVSSGVRKSARSPSFTIKRRKTVMPNLISFLEKGSIGKQK